MNAYDEINAELALAEYMCTFAEKHGIVVPGNRDQGDVVVAAFRKFVAKKNPPLRNKADQMCTDEEDIWESVVMDWADDAASE